MLCAAAVLFGVGMASAKYHLSDIGGWLASDKKGEVVHVNGLTGKVDGKVEIAGANGHILEVIQQGGAVLLLDKTTGVVSRIDPAQLNTVQGATFQGAQGMQVVEGTSVAYALSPSRGTVQQLDPMSLASIGGSVALTAPLSTNNAVDAESALWVPVPAVGQAADKPNGQQVKGVPIGKDGDVLTLTMAAGAPVVTDSTTAQSVIVGPGGSKMKVNLPPAVSQTGRVGVLAPVETDGLLVPLLNSQTGSLTILDAATGSVSSAGISLPPNHTFAPPQMLGERVYIPDRTAGQLVVWNSASHAMESSVNLTGRPDPTMDVFVKGGLLWANDPEGNKALVINSTGQATPISKYTPNVPGGLNNPIPKIGNPNGNQGAANPGNNGPGGNQHPTTSPSPQHSKTPSPKTTPNKPKRPTQPPAPNAPSGVSTVTAQSGNGTMSVQFTPVQSTTGQAPATSYTLQVSPAIPGYTPAPVSPGAQSPGWNINAGSCGTTYTFTVLTNWKDQKKDGVPVQPQGTPPTAEPCVTPGAPSNVSGRGTSTGALITWAAPANTGGALTYAVSWNGPGGSGSQPNLTSTSYTASVDVNGTYNFTVTATNGAGSSSGTGSSGVTGPPAYYTAQHAGNPGDKTKVCSTASNCSDRGTITSYNGVSLPVSCQVQGAYYTHGGSAGPDYNGNMWDYITYSGHTGFIIGYLVNTRWPNWQSYIGLPLWQCGSQSGP